MGFFLFDAISSVASVTRSIVSNVANLVVNIATFKFSAAFANMRSLVKIAGTYNKALIDLQHLGPLYRWKVTKAFMTSIDRFTGGFPTMMKNVNMIPAKVQSGDKITRQDTMDALQLGIMTAVVVFSGGSALSIIMISNSQLKKGTLGKTPLGRTILDIGTVAAGVAVGDLSVAQVIAGVATQKGSNLAVNKTALGNSTGGKLLVATTASAVGAAAGGGDMSAVIAEGGITAGSGAIAQTSVGKTIVGQALTAGAGAAIRSGTSDGDMSDVFVQGGGTTAISAVSKTAVGQTAIGSVLTSAGDAALDDSSLFDSPGNVLAAIKEGVIEVPGYDPEMLSPENLVKMAAGIFLDQKAGGPKKKKVAVKKVTKRIIPSKVAKTVKDQLIAEGVIKESNISFYLLIAALVGGGLLLMKDES